MEAPEIAFALERTTFGIYGRIKHHKKQRKKSADIEVCQNASR
jgi:hypothetical protein